MITPIHIECLDVRIAPAGVVVLDYNAVTGALSLEGDLEDNSVSIFRTGAKTFRVEGFDGTIIENGNGPTLGPGDFFDIGKLTSLSVDLGAGEDELFLTNLTLASADLILGAGNDFLEAENVVVKGVTDLNFGNDGGEAVFGGPVTILGGVFVTSTSGNSRVTFEAASTAIKGVLSLTGSSGSDELTNFGSMSIAKGVVVNGGGGDDRLDFDGPGSLFIGKSSTGQSIEFNGGAESDEIFLSNSSVNLAGFIDFDGGDGANNLSLGSGETIIKVGASTAGASIVFVGGANDDELSIDGASTALAGGIDVDGGITGSTFLTIDNYGNVRIGKVKATGHSIFLFGSADNDEIFLGGNFVTLAGGIALEGFEGNNFFDVDGANVVIGKSLTGNSLSFITGDDGDDMDIEGARVTLKGGLLFDTAGGQDQLDVSDCVFFTAPSVTFDGGDGDDSFEFETRLVNITGSVQLLGGNGNDSLAFIADGTIKGGLMADVEEGDGFQDVFISGFSGLPGNLRVLGDLSVFSFGATLSEDDVFVRDVTVGKATTIDLGDGESFVTIDNLNARGTLDILTQGGADTVLFERGSFFGGSTVAKEVVVDLGTGDDFLGIGDATIDAIAIHNRARFLGAVTLNGGGGTDSFNADLETANFFAVDPTITGFE